MQFPHLSDTRFPNLGTVNVYQFQNNFDYSRWSEKTKVKLCNVLWNSDYTDVVKWDTDAERDAWFDSLEDYWATELQTSARVVPEGYVKLPIPYDVMARYNYLFIDMPIATDAQHPIDYETDEGVRRWYFFISDIRYLAPNATQVYVVPDVWTNFQNDVAITYMLLERGHAPVAASDTATYLANPIANNRYLLAPDVNYDNAGITRSSSYVPFGNGTKYVCVASTCSPDLISSLGTVTDDAGYSPNGAITYSDDPARYGYQLIVHGFGMGNGRDYSNANTPAKVGFSYGLIANNLAVYALAATECYGNGTFLEDVIHYCPQFLTTVKACFVVDDACITRGAAYTIAGHTVYKCEGRSSTLLEKALTVADFGYPQELQRFAKLYTAPYAKLELTDNDGTTYDVNIEETSTLTVKSVVSVAFPYIDERVYIDGIGGVGSKSYQWTDLRGDTATLGMPNSDWFKYCFDWEIPTFALYMDGQTAFMLESFNRNVKQAINQSLVSYHNTMRGANTAYENACDQADTAYANTTANALTAKTNAHRSADTGKSNTDAVADTTKYNADATADTAKQNANNLATAAKSNADNSAATEKTNADNVADTNKTNADNSADLAYNTIDRTCTCQSQNLVTANTATAANEETGIAASSTVTRLSNNASANAALRSNNMLYYTTDVEVEKSTATTHNSGIGSIASSALSGAQAGVIMGGVGGASVGAVTLPVVGSVPGVAVGAIGGGVVGALGGAISAATNNVNLGVTTNTAQVIADAQAQYNTSQSQASATCATDTTDTQNDTRRVVYRTNANSSTTQMNNSNATSRANATDARNTAKTNATNVRNTTKTNAANTKTTANTNAVNTKNAADTNAANSQATAKANAYNVQVTVKGNATRTRDTSKSNATDTYDTTVACAGRTKDNVKANARYTRQVAELNAKEILENGKYAAMAAIDDSRNSAPVEVCPYGGNPQPDYMRTRGVQIKVKTQSDSAIRQTGDAFARFGYALNQVWNVMESGLLLMRNFTYWKAAEIWIDPRGASNNAVANVIHNIFLNGVTVWSDPTKIGKTNVYDN